MVCTGPPDGRQSRDSSLSARPIPGAERRSGHHRPAMDQLPVNVAPRAGSAAGQLYRVAATLELGLQALALIALDLDDVAPQGAASSAEPLQLPCQRLERRGPAVHAHAQCDAFTAATFPVAQQAHNAVAWQVKRFGRLRRGPG